MRLILPPRLDEEDRKARYDFDFRGELVRAVPERPYWHHDKDRYDWDVGICRTDFAIARFMPSSSAGRTLSHWGVYFSEVHHLVNVSILPRLDVRSTKTMIRSHDPSF